MNKPPAITLAELKDLLRRFTWERRSWAPHEAAPELGELVLCLMQQADRLGIDLVSAGEAHLERAVAKECAAGYGSGACPPSVHLAYVAPPERSQ
jgi:hypothetical protein